MNFSDHKQSIKVYKELYKNIGSIPCRYFNNEPVFFTAKGFNHFFWAGENKRSMDVLYKRLDLLFYCEHILKSHFNSVEYRTTKIGTSVAYFWGFVVSIDSRDIKLVVRQINTGHKHFFSIFPLKH